jgi:hypothetical protein
VRATSHTPASTARPRRGLPLLRYVAADATRTQHWAPPVLVYLAAVAAFDAHGGSLTSCCALTAVVLFPVATWLAVCVCGSEDPVQASITAVTVGGWGRVLAAKLVVAYLLCMVLAAVGVVWALATGHRATGPGLLAGSSAPLLTAMAGVALGGLITRPVITRIAWTTLLGAAAFVTEVVAPQAPPVRQLAVLLDRDDAHGLLPPLALVAGETIGVSALLITATHVLASRRR